MSTYSLLWLPWICGLSAVAGWLALRARRRGDMIGALRWLGWGLIPPALLLTGSARLVTRIAEATTSWAANLAFNPVTWLGVVVGAAGVALIAGSSALRRRRGPAARGSKAPSEVAAPGKDKADKAVGPARGAAPRGGAVDDDMAEIEEILRRRGIS